MKWFVVGHKIVVRTAPINNVIITLLVDSSPCPFPSPAHMSTPNGNFPFPPDFINLLHSFIFFLFVYYTKNINFAKIIILIKVLNYIITFWKV